MDIDNKNEDTPKYPNNVERTMYEFAIDHIQERIERTQDHNNELSEIFEQTERDIASTDRKTADEIAQLTRLLNIELTKINDCQRAINVIKQKRMEEQKEHGDRVNSLNKMYQDTQLKLLSEIKILNAKINALENFKDKKPILENRLQEGDDLSVKKENELKECLLQIDIKFKVDRAKLIQNLYDKLYKLSKSWTSDRRYAETAIITRLFHENVAIQHELDRCALEMDNEKDSYLQSKNSLDSSRNSTIYRQTDTIKSLIAMKIQRELIEQLKKNGGQEKMRCDRRVLSFSKNSFINYDNLIDKLQTNIQHLEREVANLKNNLHNENMKVKYTESLKNQTNKKIDDCMNTLYNVKYAIACSLQIVDSGQNIAAMTNTQLISHLEDLIKNK